MGVSYTYWLWFSYDLLPPSIDADLVTAYKNSIHIVIIITIIAKRKITPQ